MGDKLKKEKADNTRIKRGVRRAALTAVSGTAALGVAAACVLLAYYIHTELATLPARVKLLADIACAAGVIAAVLTLVYYIKSLYSNDN